MMHFLQFSLGTNLVSVCAIKAKFIGRRALQSRREIIIKRPRSGIGLALKASSLISHLHRERRRILKISSAFKDYIGIACKERLWAIYINGMLVPLQHLDVLAPTWLDFSCPSDVEWREVSRPCIVKRICSRLIISLHADLLVMRWIICFRPHMLGFDMSWMSLCLITRSLISHQATKCPVIISLVMSSPSIYFISPRG